jgi:dTDP-4-amino-4,6-dideoxygalactose transaminase
MTIYKEDKINIISEGKPALLGGTPIRSKPFPEWPEYGPEEEEGLLQVLRSREWGGYNPLIKKLEESFSARHGCDYGVAMCNGTVTLVSALKACGVGQDPQDEVIVPTYTFFATASSVRLAGAQVRFVDFDPESLNFSPAQVEAAIGPHTKAVIPVHFAGQPAALEPLLEICRKHNLALIEDAAQAHGATYKGKPVGGWGTLASFSFQASKNITAGEGGMVTTNDQNLAEQAWMQANQGRKPGGVWYEHYVVGANYRMTGFQAAILLGQLSRLDEQLARRQANAALLDKLLEENPRWGLTPVKPAHDTTSHAYHLYVMRYQSEAMQGLSRARFLEALAAEDIPSSAGYPMILSQQPVFSNKPQSGDFRHSLQAVQEAVWFAQRVLLGTEQDIFELATILERISRHAGELQA